MTIEGRDRDARVTEGLELGSDDPAFVAKMRARLRPTERSDAQNTAFDARLAERLEERRNSWVWQGGALTAAVAAALVLVLFNGADRELSAPALSDTPQVVHNEGVPDAGIGSRARVVEDALLAIAYGDAYDDDGAEEEDTSNIDEALPSDYAAIGSLLLGG
jgi:hypothetical protein